MADNGRHQLKCKSKAGRAGFLWQSILLCACLTACSAQNPKPATTAPATQTGTPVKPLETIKTLPTPMETFRALAPSDGLNLKPLFTGPTPDNEARMKRLEDAVQTLRSDFDTIMPTMVRMVAMEKSIKDLIAQLHALNGDVAAPESQLEQGEPISEEVINQADAAEATSKKHEIFGPFQPAQQPKAALEDTPEKPDQSKEKVQGAPIPITPPAEKPAFGPPHSVPAVSPTAPAESAIGAISDVRVGDHGTTTRIVLDMTAKAALTASLQKDGRQLVIELPHLSWGDKPSQTLHSTLVTAYRYENGALTLDLARPTKIKNQQFMPHEGSSGPRFVIDIAP